MIKGNKELLEMLIENKNSLEEKNEQLCTKERILYKKTAEANHNMHDYIEKLDKYIKLREEVLLNTVTNLFEITGVGLGIGIFLNLLNNDVTTLAEAFKSVETFIVLSSTIFGNLIIVGDSYFTLHNYQQENLKDHNLKEIVKERDSYFEKLNTTRKSISEINQKLNKYNSRIEEVSRIVEYKYDNRYENNYDLENSLEKPVQKVKM